MIVGVTGLYTGSEIEPGYSIMSCLKRSQYPLLKLVGLSPDPVFGCAFRKDLMDRTYLVPPLSEDNVAIYLKRIREIKSENGLDILIPATDKEIAILAHCARELKGIGVSTLLPSVSTMDAVSNKDRIKRFQSRGAITMPSISLGDTETAVGNTAAMNFSLVKNPVSEPLPHQQAAGDYYSVAVLTDRNKKIKAVAAVHQLLVSKGGSTWMGKIVFIDAIHDTARKLAVYLKWTGPMTINLFTDKKGRIFIMHIHPGLPDWINFVADCGLNFPAMILDIIGGKTVAPVPVMTSNGFFVRMSVDMVTDVSDFGIFSLKGVLSHE